MPKNLIKDHMKSPVLSIDSGKIIREAAEFMMSKGVRSLLVKEGDDYVGIVTKTDFISKVYITESMDPDSDLVFEIMSKSILTMDINSTMEEARKYMQKNQIGHLGVTEDDKIIGVLSKEDLLGYFGRLN